MRKPAPPLTPMCGACLVADLFQGFASEHRSLLPSPSLCVVSSGCGVNEAEGFTVFYGLAVTLVCTGHSGFFSQPLSALGVKFRTCSARFLTPSPRRENARAPFLVFETTVIWVRVLIGAGSRMGKDYDLCSKMRSREGLRPWPTASFLLLARSDTWVPDLWPSRAL